MTSTECPVMVAAVFVDTGAAEGIDGRPTQAVGREDRHARSDTGASEVLHAHLGE